VRSLQKRNVCAENQIPLVLLMLTGLYLFVLPYAANWRGE
jgi:hypothetical protein